MRLRTRWPEENSPPPRRKTRYVRGPGSTMPSMINPNAANTRQWRTSAERTPNEALDLAAVRTWLATEPESDRMADYNDYVRAENKLRGGPYLMNAAAIAGCLRLDWEAVL